MSEANVKVTHLRARRAMTAYDRARCVPTRELHDRTRQALERFMIALSSNDVAAMEALLADDIRHLSDGGEFPAAHRPVVGRRKVTRLFFGLNRHLGTGASFSVRTINGLPALLIDFGLRGTRYAPRGVIRADVDLDGRITAVHAVLASRKLTAVQF